MKATRFLQNAIPSKVSQITVEGFANAVLKVWRPSNDPRQTATIGLAISGGVDSMALAFLCSRLKELKTAAADQPDPKHDILSSVKFQAFVVDHGVRRGSDLEAQAVSKLLERQGIPTDVLKIQWPEDATLKLNFESLARKYRFRTLGQACSERGIGSLFLAHHEDDQAETVMMRLVAGHRSKGLMGIKEHSEIPECYGIHGVHESGGIDDPRMRWSEGPPASAPEVEDHERGTLASRPQLLTENGGVRVYRPLLAFSKQQLTATCQGNSVEWFEDHTNRDQTLTKRNAIRHMFATHSLPSALTKPSLLSLSLKIRAKETQRQATITSLLTQCKITHLDLRTGTAKVQFPDLSLSTHPQATSGQTAAELLKRIAMLVSPEQHIELSSLHGAVAHLFPELLPGATRPPPATPVAPPPAFTVCGVYFQRVGATTVSGGEATRKPRWLVSRQPYPSRAKEKDARRYHVKFPPADGGVWSPWRLWDGRYWIRVQNRSSRTLLVRPLLPSEWPDVALRLGDDHSARVKRICREKATGARWTVLAVVARLHDGREVVVALPTFGLDLNLYAIEGWDSVKWEIRYKKIDIAGLRISDEKGEVE
ncbi:uncharacterized protein L3040_000259 [Drepanopeziza brunnea f. sp. 'multigermtubi']|uniref:tRNA(Ile)-lysidine synthetase n=1 Tax=Marssonina brunnea f. sp. multigermtubi (strain MB_m1) TaxID=1072389 RepID=K1WHG9_MARBU|nr:PP-loop family protein [Drepanopeziza brunnea f. sp. 'multigermtubi' MB_m1]EKD12271.1 PP-loop family protein [Drepanopeziza brunnea f. sp. 'multigermtubi' MB_m1]KAJ5053970.1 hypothetical protein L3040_000259 [Drepanopeziza brunnea f. sp. 'multigermtubi']